VSHFLSEILARKRVEVAERRAQVGDAQLEKRLTRRVPIRLFDALSAANGPCRVIAEVKRASPSVGAIDSALDAPRLAERYAQANAAAISVLTDGPGFGGSLQDLEAIRARVAVPLLRKDFIIDRYQLLEAHLAGADVVLLIVAALDDSQLKTLHEQAEALGLSVLVEVHDEPELNRALAMGSRIVGINNRDLKSFSVDLATSERLLPKVPRDVRAVAESGVKTLADAKRLRAAGAANFLVGEALVRAESPEKFLAEIGALK
jgi:indole-3-glycerol phosphate synthase